MAKSKRSPRYADLVKKIDLQKLYKVEEAIDIFFNEMSTALVCGDRVELRGFGSMVVRKRESGIARNPKNGATVQVEDRGSLYFRASKDLLKELNSSADNDN